LKLFRTKMAGFLLILILLGLWEAGGQLHLVTAVAFPPFSRVFNTLLRMVANGSIFAVAAPSIERLFVGYLLALLFGVSLGMAMGYFRVAYNVFEPLTEVLRPIPTPAYVPIAILFLGLGDEMKIFVIAFASFFPILLNTYSGVQSVDVIQINTARTFGYGGIATLWKVVLPAASPQIFTGMRISVAISLIMVVISEMVASVDGIGYFILNAERSFRVPEMYAGVIVLGVLGYALNWLFLRCERYALRWHIDAMRREGR